MIISPPFVRNFDYNHCLQASILMILGSIGYKTDFQEIDQLTDYEPNLYTWGIVAASILQKKIPGTQFFSTNDYKKFASQGQKYLEQIWNSDTYKDQKEKASLNFSKEQQAAQEFFQQRGKLQILTKQITDVELSALLKHNILIVWVNASKFYSKQVYGGHFLVLYGEINDKYIIHDSGFSTLFKGKNAKKVDKAILLAAVGDVIAIQKKELVIGKSIGKNDPCYCKSEKEFKHCHLKSLEKQGLRVFE